LTDFLVEVLLLLVPGVSKTKAKQGVKAFVQKKGVIKICKKLVKSKGYLKRLALELVQSMLSIGGIKKKVIFTCRLAGLLVLVPFPPVQMVGAIAAGVCAISDLSDGIDAAKDGEYLEACKSVASAMLECCGAAATTVKSIKTVAVTSKAAEFANDSKKAAELVKLVQLGKNLKKVGKALAYVE
jgi:hypothetical protein